ncbi:MAG: hypothetical protein REI45_00170 [Propionicimonas sp.]|nr:hypothetical protein [Propionicimonas sp.]
MAFPYERLRGSGRSVATEGRALVFALGALTLAFVASLIDFSGTKVPLSGAGSVGVVGATAAGLFGVIAFAWGFLRANRTARRRRGRVWRTALDVFALTVIAAGIVTLLAATVFAVVALAFQDFLLDPPVAAVLVGVTAALASYILTIVSAEVTALAIANLLALFLISGGMASMLSASDPLWWQRNFSALGGGNGFSSYAFNVTIVFAGLAIVTLTHYLTSGLLEDAAAGERRRIIVLRLWLVVVGLLLSGVGIVTVEEAGVAHTVIATSMAVVFGALIIATPLLLPRLPRSFRLTSAVFVAAFAFVVLLMWPIGYFNLTAVELIGSVVLLTWLFVFVRTVVAMLEDERSAAQLEPAPPAA